MKLWSYIGLFFTQFLTPLSLINMSQFIYEFCVSPLSSDPCILYHPIVREVSDIPKL